MNIVLSIILSFSVHSFNQSDNLRGVVRIDGSSTVFPITEAVAEEYSEEAPNVRVTVGVSGTGGGFKRFAARETDISNASRPIKPGELALCQEAKISFIELPIAYDGLTIVVNKKNKWMDNITMHELNAIFEGGMKKWSDVRASWPNEDIVIYSPGTDSGTFDYFKEVVIGKRGSMRSDMSVSEDDNVLVKGVMGDEHAIGFFGCAYYFANEEKLRAVPVVNPLTGKAVAPTPTNIENGSYAPFSRPLFIYVNVRSMRRPEVRSFVSFYVDHCNKMAEEVGYVSLPSEMTGRVRKNLAERQVGTRFLTTDGKKVHGSLEKIYK
jgi:phosphate transport system substrate-binding protein